MSKVLAITLVLLLSFVGVTGDALLKLSGRSEKMDWRFFILGFAIYASTAIGWFFVMKHLKLGTIGVFYSIATALLLTFAGVIFFNEHLTSPEWLGILLAIISLALLGRFA